MKLLSIIPWRLRIEKKNKGELTEKPQVKDPTVRFLQWACVSTITFGVGLWLGMTAIGFTVWITQRERTFQMLSEMSTAFFTGTLVVVTAVLAWYTFKLWSTTANAVILDQTHRMRVHVAAYPPEIRVESVALSRAPDDSVPLGIVFFLRNVGKTDATIEHCITSDRYRGGRPAVPLLYPEIMGKTIAKYDTLPLNHKCQTITTTQLDSLNPTLNPQFEVTVYYKDGEGSPFTTNATFRWIPQQNEFVSIPDEL